MKIRRFATGLLACWTLTHSLPQLLQACEQCRSRAANSECGCTDDRGLLDWLDSTLQRRRPVLAQLSLPGLPSLRGATGSLREARCGCEPREASCGCELHEPTCVCEASTGCNGACSKSQGGTSAPVPTSRRPAPPVESPYYDSSGDYYAEPLERSHSGPSLPDDTHVAPRHLPHSTPVSPLQQPAPVDTVPLPDSKVDPFLDEGVQRLRPVPARPVGTGGVQRLYRQDYDPQASRSKAGGTAVRAHLSDAVPTAEAYVQQEQSVAAPLVDGRSRFAPDSSSRLRTTANERIRSAVDGRATQVITASGAQQQGESRNSARISEPVSERSNPLRTR